MNQFNQNGQIMDLLGNLSEQEMVNLFKKIDDTGRGSSQELANANTKSTEIPRNHIFDKVP